MLAREAPEITRVTTVGLGGWLATLTLERVNLIVSLCVGVATLTYVIIKIVYVLKHHGKAPD